MADLDDALAGMTRRQIEQLVERARLALQSCAICGAEHADAYAVTRGGARASILLCPACFERQRLPEGRAAVEVPA